MSLLHYFNGRLPKVNKVLKSFKVRRLRPRLWSWETDVLHSYISKTTVASWTMPWNENILRPFHSYQSWNNSACEVICFLPNSYFFSANGAGRRRRAEPHHRTLSRNRRSLASDGLGNIECQGIPGIGSETQYIKNSYMYTTLPKIYWSVAYSGVSIQIQFQSLIYIQRLPSQIVFVCNFRTDSSSNWKINLVYSGFIIS